MEATVFQGDWDGYYPYHQVWYLLNDNALTGSEIIRAMQSTASNKKRTPAWEETILEHQLIAKHVRSILFDMVKKNILVQSTTV